MPAVEEAPCLASQACPHTERSSSFLSMKAVDSAQQGPHQQLFAAVCFSTALAG